MTRGVSVDTLRGILLRERGPRCPQPATAAPSFVRRSKDFCRPFPSFVYKMPVDPGLTPRAGDWRPFGALLTSARDGPPTAESPGRKLA